MCWCPPALCNLCHLFSVICWCIGFQGQTHISQTRLLSGQCRWIEILTEHLRGQGGHQGPPTGYITSSYPARVSISSSASADHITSHELWWEAPSPVHLPGQLQLQLPGSLPLYRRPSQCLAVASAPVLWASQLGSVTCVVGSFVEKHIFIHLSL